MSASITIADLRVRIVGDDSPLRSTLASLPANARAQLNSTAKAVETSMGEIRQQTVATSRSFTSVQSEMSRALKSATADFDREYKQQAKAALAADKAEMAAEKEAVAYLEQSQRVRISQLKQLERAELDSLNTRMRAWKAEIAEQNAALASARAAHEQYAQQIAQGAKMAGVAMVGFGAAVLGGIGVATKVAGDFDQAMRNVNSIAQLGEASFKSLGKSVLALTDDPSVIQTPRDLAKSLYDIESSGFHGAKGMEVLKESAIGATAGMTDTATSGRVLMAVLNSEIPGVQSSRQAMDVLFQSVNVGVFTFKELAETIGRVLPAAKVAGVSLQEIGAAMAALTRRGLDADSAATGLRQILVQLETPSKKQKQVLDELGVSSGLLGLKATGLTGVLAQMARLTDEQKASLVNAIPEVRAMTAYLSLADDQGRSFTDMLGEMTHATDGIGAAQKAANQQIQGFGDEAAKTRQLVEKLEIQVGTDFLPVAKDLLEWADNSIKAWNDLGDSTKHTIEVMAGFGAGGAVVVGSLISIGAQIAQTAIAFKTLQALRLAAVGGGAIEGGAAVAGAGFLGITGAGLAGAAGAVAAPAAGVAIAGGMYMDQSLKQWDATVRQSLAGMSTAHLTAFKAYYGAIEQAIKEGHGSLEKLTKEYGNMPIFQEALGSSSIQGDLAAVKKRADDAARAKAAALSGDQQNAGIAAAYKTIQQLNPELEMSRLKLADLSQKLRDANRPAIELSGTIRDQKTRLQELVHEAYQKWHETLTKLPAEMAVERLQLQELANKMRDVNRPSDDLTRSLSRQKDELASLTATMKRHVSDGLRDMEREQAKLTGSIKESSLDLDLQKDSLKRLSAQLAQIASDSGKGSEAYKQAQLDLVRQQNSIRDLTYSLEDMRREQADGTEADRQRADQAKADARQYDDLGRSIADNTQKLAEMKSIGIPLQIAEFKKQTADLTAKLQENQRVLAAGVFGDRAKREEIDKLNKSIAENVQRWNDMTQAQIPLQRLEIKKQIADLTLSIADQETKLRAAIKTIGTTKGAWDAAANAIKAAAPQYISQMRNLGQAIADGTAAGITAGKSAIVKAMADAIGEAIRSAQSILEIHSPSKVFADMGQQSMAGYAMGVDQSAQGASDAVSQAMFGMVQAASSPWNDLANMLGVPKYDDLGQALGVPSTTTMPSGSGFSMVPPPVTPYRYPSEPTTTSAGSSKTVHVSNHFHTTIQALDAEGVNRSADQIHARVAEKVLTALRKNI